MQKHLDHDDFSTNPSDAPEFGNILASKIERRDILKAGAATSALGFFGLNLANSAVAKSAAQVAVPSLGFKAIAANTEDKITVPEGYSYQVFSRWGDPLFANSPKWHGDASENADAQGCKWVTITTV